MKTYTIFYSEKRKIYRDYVTTSGALAADVVYKRKRQHPERDYWYETTFVPEVTAGVSG